MTGQRVRSGQEQTRCTEALQCRVLTQEEGLGKVQAKDRPHVGVTHISVDVGRQACDMGRMELGQSLCRGSPQAQRAGSRVSETEVRRTEGTVMQRHRESVS